MLPKPRHLGEEYAAQFRDPSVAAVYHHRLPYPDDTFAILQRLMPPGPHHVLDLGCGTGDITRPLAPLVDRIDAVDVSEPMIEEGKRQPGGKSRRIRWLRGRAEGIQLEPPYSLVTAGESLHWMEWEVVLPRLASVLLPGAYLAILGRATEPTPWDEGLTALIARHSTNRDFKPFNLVEALVQRQLFKPEGDSVTGVVEARQSIESYVESIHSRNGFSRDRMSPGDAETFDREVIKLLQPFATDGVLRVQSFARVVWGIPVSLTS